MKKKPPADALPAVSVRISEALHVRAKIYAATTKMKLQAALDLFIEEGLKKRGA